MFGQSFRDFDNIFEQICFKFQKIHQYTKYNINESTLC